MHLNRIISGRLNVIRIELFSLFTLYRSFEYFQLIAVIAARFQSTNDDNSGKNENSMRATQTDFTVHGDGDRIEIIYGIVGRLCRCAFDVEL